MADTDIPKIPKPAMRALNNNGVHQLSDLLHFPKSQIASWHGMGPKALGILDEALKRAKLKWMDE